MKSKITIWLILISLLSFPVVAADSVEEHYQFDIYQLRTGEFEKLVDEGSSFLKSDDIDSRFFVVSTEDNEVVETNAYYYESFSFETIKFLSQKNAIITFFENNSISNIEEYKILLCTDVIDGYILYAENECERYFVPVMSHSEYSGFDNFKIYTAKDIEELSANRPGKLIVNNVTISTDVAPVFIYGNPFMPLRAVLESIGIDVDWDQKRKCATFGNLELCVEENVNPEQQLTYLDGEPYPAMSFFIMKKS